MEYVKSFIEDGARLIAHTDSAVGHCRNSDNNPDHNTRDSPNSPLQSSANALEQEAQDSCGILVSINVRITKHPTTMKLD